MASWKKVIVSGSNISQLNNDSSFLVDNTDIAALGQGIVSSSAQVGDLAGVNDNTITITAGNGISFASGDGAFTLNQGSDETIADIAVDLNELTAKTTIVQADSIAIIDSEDSNASKKITLSNLEDEIFGNVSGDATIAAGGALTIANDAIDLGMLANGALSVTASGDVAGEAALSADAVQIALTIQSNAVENSMMADDSVDSAEIVDGAIDAVHFSAGAKTAISGAFTSTSASIATDIAALESAAYALNIEGDSGNGIIDNVETLDIAGGSNITTTMSGNTLTVALDNDITITGNLTVGGTRTELNVANLNVEDQFILLNSGSTSGDSGIIFGGTGDGTANAGHAIFVDDSDNDGATFGFKQNLAHDVSTGGAPDSKLGNIESSTAVPVSAPTFQGVGTIHIKTDTEDIYIYA